MVPPVPYQAATTGQSLKTALFLMGEASIWGARPNSSYRIFTGAMKSLLLLPNGQACFVSKG